MCRLLGASLSAEAAFERSWLDAFARLAETGIVSAGSLPGHQDGWGLAGMVDGAPRIFGRRAGSILGNPDGLEQATGALLLARPPSVMAHLRKASPGLAVSDRNAHPFCIARTLFCHNGSIRQPDRLPVADPGVIQGSTDSERWFAFLMEHTPAGSDDDFTGALADALRASRTLTEASSWTCLLARGGRLYAYREAREASYDPEDEPAGECLRTHTLWLAPVAGGMICCSEPLTGIGPWSGMANRELVVLEHGMVQSRHRV